MAERTSYASGTPSWVELQTTDALAAKTFYGELFAWTYDDRPLDETNVYSLAQVRGLDVGAITNLGEQGSQGVPPHWNSFISVDDVDAAVARVAPAGGTVVMDPFDVFDEGRMAVVQDPTGAIFELWQPKQHIGASLVNEPGAFTWSELITPDVPKAAAFYNALLGWGTNEPEGEMPYTEFQLDGVSIAGAMNPPMPGIPPMWGIYFAVTDTDATVERAKSLGGSIAVEPTDIPPGRFAVIVDPQGALFNVIKTVAA
jgi:uncharacterized protein